MNMKKSYMLLLALLLTVMGTSFASAKIYRTTLDKSMFKAWTSADPGATVVENPAAIDVTDANPEGTKFACDYVLYQALGDWSGIYGSTAAYYLWYADLTGTQKIYFTGTPGLHFFVQFNRVAPEEGASDTHGGAMTQEELTIGDDGTVVYDCSKMEYVHLNCIKTKSAGIKGGVIKSIKIEGTVEPVVGIKSVINNGDAEGDDLASFPVSLDGPNNDNTANDLPEVVAGEGVDGSKCFKVTAFETPTEVWHTQFYIKADEVMAKGAKWKLKMAIKASKQSQVTTSAQAQPRTWKGGMINEFTVYTDWKEYTWSGEIGVDDFQSIAFDLNNGEERNDAGDGWKPGNGGTEFFFDNIEFGYDLGGDSPVENFQAFFDGDVIRLDMTSFTNIKDLVKAAPGGKFLLFPAGTFTVKVDDEAKEVDAAAAYDDGQIYIWINGRMDEDSKVEVAFNNPEAAETHLKFVGGEFDGQDIPAFAALISSYRDGAGNGKVSPSFALPTVIGCDPEAGSFNLPKTLNTFVVSFDNPINPTALTAKLGAEALTVNVSADNKVATLTRTAATELNGTRELILEHIKAVAGLGEESSDTIKFSFGPVNAEEGVELIYAANFTESGDDNKAAGWKVNKDGGEELQDANTGAGCRLMHGQTAFAADILYLAQRESNPRCPNGVALYGIVENYALTLAAKTYHLSLDASKWDRDNDRTLLVQVLPLTAVNTESGAVTDETAILAQERKAITPTLASKEAIHFDIAFTVETAGDYVIRMVPGDANGNPNGYADGCAIGNVKVEYIPDVMGIVETQALNEALNKAKATLETVSENTRYAGADQNNLSAYIQDVETNMAGYTAPSVYAAKTEGLGAAEKALNEHKSACDTYDENIKKVINVVADKADTKFKNSPVYADIKAVAEKYHGTIEKTVTPPEVEGDDSVVVVKYSFDLLTDNDSLAAANTELTSAAALGDNFFTEVALDADIQQGNCGIAVLTERLRLGARTLMSLGVSADDEMIKRVQNAMTDDDDLADEIKKRITGMIYDSLSVAEPTLFDPTEEDLEAGIETGRAYDMTVFLKNPNIYAVDGTKDLSEENVPGWKYPQGNPGKFTAWGARNVAGLPEDCAFTTWFGTNRMEQTITDLPVGLYIVSLCGSDWSNQAGNSDNPHDVNGFVYCKLSDTPEVEEGEEEDKELHFAATRTIVYGGQYNMDHAINLGVEEVIDDETGFVKTTDDDDAEVFGIPVVDGFLTLGIQFAGDAQYFFQHARLTLIGAAENFDYEKAKTGIEATPAPAKVRAIQVYDLNGRRMIKTHKGLQIVKKQMTDGTVRVEKVVVK